MSDGHLRDETDGRTDEEDRAWYEQPVAYGAAALLGLLACIAIVLVAVNANDDPKQASSTATTTTVPADERDCAEGDAEACTRLDGRTLSTLCDDDVEEACAEILTRLGEASQSTSTSSAPVTAAPESAVDRCQAGDASACSELSDESIDGLCGAGVDAACQEADIRFESSPISQCSVGDSQACAGLSDQDLTVICPDPAADPQYEPCAERNARGI